MQCASFYLVHTFEFWRLCEVMTSDFLSKQCVCEAVQVIVWECVRECYDIIIYIKQKLCI